MPHPLFRLAFSVPSNDLDSTSVVQHLSQLLADNDPSTFELRVQTDGEVTPKAAMQQACTTLISELSNLGKEFVKEWELRKMAGESANVVDK